MNRACVSLALLALVGCGGAAPPVEPPPTDAEENETFAVALRLAEAGPDAEDTPHTRVSLVRIAPDGARHMEALRVETGACWHVGSGEDVLIAVRCWWAGAGAQYAVHRTGDAIVVPIARGAFNIAPEEAACFRDVDPTEEPEEEPELDEPEEIYQERIIRDPEPELPDRD